MAIEYEENILVPVEITGQGLIAFEQACNIAEQMKLDVIVAYIEPVKKVSQFLNGFFPDYRKEEIENSIQGLVRKTAMLKGLKIETLHCNGDVRDKVFSIAKRCATRFIVMNTLAPESGPQSRKIGYHGQRILHSVPCPVISINGIYHYRGFRTILLPLDFTVETRRMVSRAVESARYFQSKILIVTVVQKNLAENQVLQIRQQMVQAKMVIQESNIDCETEILMQDRKKGSEADHILDYAVNRKDIDLILIMIRQEMNMAENFMGSTAQKLIRCSDIPVMSIIPDKQQSEIQ